MPLHAFRRTIVAVVLLLSSGADAAERPIAIFNATVLDGRGGPPRPGLTVLIRGSRIEKLLGRGERVPRHAQRVDGHGGFLLPGFIDVHAHLLVPRCQPPAGSSSPFDRALSERMLGRLLDFGITTVRSPATPTIEGLALRNDLNAGRVRGPKALASAELLNDPSMGGQALRAYVKDALRYRPDYFKAYARLSAEQVEILVDEAHKAGVPVIGHLQRTSWTEGARLGIDALTHAANWSETNLRPDRRAAYAKAIQERGPMRARLDWLELLDLSSPEVSEMIDEVARRGIPVDPTLVAYDSKFSAPGSPSYRQNRFAADLPELRQDWISCPGAAADWTEEDHQRWNKLFPKLQALVMRMHQAGVLLTTGSDLTNEWVIPGESLHQEFELLVRAGLTPAEVLRMTGENAAKSLRREDVGVIAEGRRADLVLLGRNPLESIGNSRSIRWVMQGGRIVASELRPAARERPKLRK